MYFGKEKKMSLKEDLTTAINKNSAENDSDTPDFILASYLIDCLEAFNKIHKSRSAWYGISPYTLHEKTSLELSLKVKEFDMDYKKAYLELIMAVVRAFPNESRHETALRYIREAEKITNEAACESRKN